MKFKNIIGIDTGKSSIDFSFLENGEKKKIGIVENSVKKLELFFNDLKIDVKKNAILHGAHWYLQFPSTKCSTKSRCKHMAGEPNSNQKINGDDTRQE